jgi:hypothetical protein
VDDDNALEPERWQFTLDGVELSVATWERIVGFVDRAEQA